MKKAGIILIVLGILGTIFIYGYDSLVKHEPAITLGPRSGPALGVTILVLIIGVILTTSQPPKKSG